ETDRPACAEKVSLKDRVHWDDGHQRHTRIGISARLALNPGHDAVMRRRNHDLASRLRLSKLLLESSEAARHLPKLGLPPERKRLELGVELQKLALLGGAIMFQRSQPCHQIQMAL